MSLFVMGIFAHFFLAEQGVLDAPAGAAGGEEEPVHEDAVAVVVGVVGQQAVPLVLLLAGAVAGATQRARGAGKFEKFDYEHLNNGGKNYVHSLTCRFLGGRPAQSSWS